MSPPHLLLALVIDLGWGFNFIAARVGVTEIPPLLFITLRFTLVLILLSPFLRWKRGMMRDIFIVALFAGVLQFAFMFTGTAASNASVAAILAQLQLPFATLLAIVFLKEHVGWRRWSGIGLALVGMAVLGFDPLIIHYWLGALLVTLASLMTAISQIFMRRMKEIGVLELQAWIAAVTAPSVLVLSFLLERHRWHELSLAPTHLWALVAYTGIVASIFGQSGMFFLLKRYDVAIVVTLIALAQVFGTIFGVLLLHEPMTPRVAVGALVICGGVVIIALRQRGAPGAPVGLAEAEVGVIPPPLKTAAPSQIVER